MKTNYKTLGKIAAAIISIVLTATSSIAQNLTEGPNNGLSTLVIANSASTWQNASNVLLKDNHYATIILSTGHVSDTLEVENFHFHIPADAVIKGITVTIEKGTNGAEVYDHSIKLIKNGAVCGDEHARMLSWPQSADMFNYGDESDLWGLNWSAADINSYAFGIAVSVANSSYMLDSAEAAIGYISISVAYDRPKTLTVQSFGAVYNKGVVNINWAALTQGSNSKFTIERSKDGIETEPIGAIKAAGTDQSMNYSYVDSLPLSGTSYYRLKETDNNGGSQAFEWASVTIASKITDMVVYPNPGKGAITIEFPSSENQSILMIMDASGKVVMNETVPASETTETRYVKDVSELPTGTYILLVNQDGKNYTKKFIRG